MFPNFDHVLAMGEKLVIFATCLFTLWNTYRVGRTDQKVTESAKVLHEVHILSNHNMEMSLLAVWTLSEEKAVRTKLPEDIAAATKARANYEEHVKKQEQVDREHNQQTK